MRLLLGTGRLEISAFSSSALFFLPSHTDNLLRHSTLAVGEVLVVPTRATSGTVVANNIAQCATVLSNDTRFAIPEGTTAVVPGEYALAAVDGANAVSFRTLFNS